MHVGAAAVRATGRDRRTIAVAAGDVVAVAGVLTVGMLRHGVDPLAVPDHAVLVLAPFLLGWALAAVPLGAYTDTTFRAARSTVGIPLLAWVPAALVGGALRATPVLPGNAPPVFLAVVVGFGALALAGWRVAVALVLR